jgi:hypothetical protein
MGADRGIADSWLRKSATTFDAEHAEKHPLPERVFAKPFSAGSASSAFNVVT